MKEIKNYIFDMDGVLVRGNTPIPGIQEMLNRLEEKNINFAMLTNNPFYTPKDLQHKLAHSGLEIQEERIYTSAMATASFIDSQHPNGSAYVIGESGLTTAIHNVGYTITKYNPDYVILGETTNYSFDQISEACTLIKKGARFICTNPDPSGPVENGGVVPSAGALAALVSTTTGIKPYYIGKPNPLMMRSVLRYIGAHSSESAMVGDRMETDIKAGLEAGMTTILVLTGLTTREKAATFPYSPTVILESAAELEKD